MGYENKTTPGRRKILKHQLTVKKRKLETGDSDSDMEITELDTTLESEPGTNKENYPRTTCIIDCAETFIQRPTNLRSRGETDSNYKSHNTAKYLVGISPHGQIMFISKAFGGRASDKFIVEKSGVMNYLLLGDEIMADRGFTIDDLLFPLRVKLNIPAFTKTNLS
ncbi:unnamed protein product [Mytilus coruscus]|uniref:DDE Tnp4 domain-containing protein n=1 Tax=Mytilus coruscus TaxID=42192 RepID=A0A6J8CPX8_MYTCO|nr:unnamed protein product [Mytilus coruscus]